MLDQLLGAQLGTTAKFAIAFLLVLVLIGITAIILKRFGGSRMPSSGGGRNRQPRLAVLDSAIVDAKRRLVLIRRDNSEHLLLIGGPSDVVVETNIVRGAAAPGAQPMERRPRGLPQQELETLESSLVPEPAYEEPAPRAPQPAPRMREREPAPRPQPRQQPQPEPVEDFFHEPPQRAEPLHEPAAYSPPPPLPPRTVAHPSAIAPAPQPAPSPAQTRNDPQYADMAHQLETALRKPATAPAARAPEPRIAAPAPQPRTAPTPPMPQTRPMPAAPAPATAKSAAPAASKQDAPNPFDSLEAEMANLLGQDKKR
jgi:flagellar protein FliO/FliZ